jgi:hypothetical protein
MLRATEEDPSMETALLKESEQSRRKSAPYQEEEE